jgi:hypothetical protein
LSLRSVDTLAGCAQLDGIRELDLCHNHFTAAEAAPRLAKAPALTKLQRLCL